MRELFRDEMFKSFILDLNTEGQLFEKGIDSKGKQLKSDFARFGQVYANFTINIKNAKGQPTDRVTLRDSGDFHSSFKLELDSNDDFEITADTIKEDTDLIEVWGEDILGLTDESLDQVIEYAREIIIPIVKDEILRQAA